MERLLATVLSAYGFQLSWQSTRTIRRLHAEAARGNADAASHFTQTRYARALGPRNSDLGMLFYGALGIAAVTGLLRRRPVLDVLYYGSSLSLGVSLYLLWALAFRLRVLCPICLRGHLTNLAVFVLLVYVRKDST